MRSGCRRFWWLMVADCDGALSLMSGLVGSNIEWIHKHFVAIDGMEMDVRTSPAPAADDEDDDRGDDEGGSRDDQDSRFADSSPSTCFLFSVESIKGL